MTPPDDVRAVLHELLTLADGQQLTVRDDTMYLADAPGTLIDKLGASVLFYRGWLGWKPTDTGYTGTPTCLGRVVLQTWDLLRDTDLTFTDADEAAFQRALFDVTPDDIETDRP